MAPKSTKGQKLEQLIETCEMLCKGYTRSHIIEHFKVKWGLARSQADQSIKAATKRLAEINEGSIEKIQSLVLQGLWKQYRNADAEDNRAAAINALKEIAKLKGLDQTTVHLKIDRPLEDLSDEELAEALSDNS